MEIIKEPFEHIILKDYFKKELLNKVKKELLKEKFIKTESDLFQFKQTNDLKQSKNKIIKEFYLLLNSKEFKKQIESLFHVKVKGNISASGFIYSSTDYLLPHDDKLENRKVAFTINLSDKFTENDGGTLDFFKDNTLKRSIKPEFNIFTLFKVISNKSIHQVSEVLSNKKRITITGWYNA